MFGWYGQVGGGGSSDIRGLLALCFDFLLKSRLMWSLGATAGVRGVGRRATRGLRPSFALPIEFPHTHIETFHWTSTWNPVP